MSEQTKTPANLSPAPPKSPALGPRLSVRPSTASPRSASKVNGTAATTSAAQATNANTASPSRNATNAPEDKEESPAPKTGPPRSPHVNGNKPTNDEGDADSELSDPDSNVHSPDGVHDLADEIVVSNRDDRDLPSSPFHALSDDEDENMTDAREEFTSPYPKRRRAGTYADADDSRHDLANGHSKGVGSALAGRKPTRQSVGGVKGVVIGYWRDAPVPEENRKHAVIGFIDVRDRLRTRIQPTNLLGEQISLEYALPPGPGGSWVTFERIVFLDHLVGLDQSQIKEYVRIRADAPAESPEDQDAAEKQAAKDAVTRVKNNPTEPATQPQIAYGLKLPSYVSSPARPETKRRKTSSGFAPITPAPQQEQSRPASQASSARTLDPLHGTRPTRILLGYWANSDEPNIRDRHAVYGILGHNDMFRVKLVRETRDGRFVDGNFPLGAGALWIPYEEVVMDDHLRHLSRSEVKEYCRVRQYQVDQGETPEDRATNEAKAVTEAQRRVNFGAGGPGTSKLNIAPEPSGNQASDKPNGHELRTSRRTEARLLAQAATANTNTNAASQEQPQSQTQDPLPGRDRMSRAEARPEARTRRSTGGIDTPPVGRGPGRERTTALAQREISRAEATQQRADIYAAHRERATAVAVQEANAAAAAASSAPRVNGTSSSSFTSSGDIERLNSVWARQESLRARAGAEDVKVYDGRKYERKSNGPFVGKLTSQGSLISIDGEDYIEYRVLMKPTFY